MTLNSDQQMAQRQPKVQRTSISRKTVVRSTELMVMGLNAVTEVRQPRQTDESAANAALPYPSSQYVRSVDEKQALSKLKPLPSRHIRINDMYDKPAIEIKGVDDQYTDAYNLLDKATSISSLTSGSFVPDIEIVMLQLRHAHGTQHHHDDKDKVIIRNNLGCAYALLGRYKEAQDTLNEEKITQGFTDESIQRLNDEIEKVRHNLSIVKQIVAQKK